MAANCINSTVASLSSSLVNQASSKNYRNRSVFLHCPIKQFQSLRLTQRPSQFQVNCAAKPETVEKVCNIVKKQLALPDGSDVTAQSKFSALGADSLDTVEIVMGLEEEFGITVGEDTAQNIVSVQDAADLIEELVSKKTG
ncbi:unnamed protein product [Victoria cruziana]